MNENLDKELIDVLSQGEIEFIKDSKPDVIERKVYIDLENLELDTMSFDDGVESMSYKAGQIAALMKTGLTCLEASELVFNIESTALALDHEKYIVDRQAETVEKVGIQESECGPFTAQFIKE